VLLNIPVPGAADAPGTHAFVIGVSRYPYADGPEATEQGEQLGLANLSSATKSASEVAAWLLKEYRNPKAPLASLHLFLSPSEGEQIHPDVVAAMNGAEAPALRDAVEVEFNQFREDCRKNTDNVAFVYVSGHGIQLNKRGAVVLLQDFAVKDRALLYGAIDIAGCRDAMDETGNAHEQAWFSDACRQRPEIVKKFESLAGAYKPDEGNGQVDASPLFLASSTRESAFADVNSTTIFCQALLWALRGAAAVGNDESCDVWHVPATRLINLLPKRVRALLAGKPEEQQVDVAGHVLDMVVQQFEQPPEVEMEVNLRPEAAASGAVAELLFEGEVPREVAPSWPLRFTGAAGLYQLTVTTSVPVPSEAKKLLSVAPPVFHDFIEVG
jgi:Caspase domain